MDQAEIPPQQLIPNNRNAVSDRKVAANRENAKRSTGPRTERGKRNSKYNSLRHGILARVAVIRTGPYKEDEQAFNRLLRGLFDSHQPVGTQEELLVEEIGVLTMRKMRVLRHETGHIQANIEQVMDDREDPPVLPEQRRFLSWLRLAEKIVRRDGILPSEMWDRFSSLSRMPDFRQIEEDLKSGLQWPSPFVDPKSSQGSKMFHIAIEPSLRKIHEYLDPLEEAVELEDHDLDLIRSVHTLPDPQTTDIILRYFGQIERELTRAVGVLVGLQSIRRAAEADSAKRSQEAV